MVKAIHLREPSIVQLAHSRISAVNANNATDAARELMKLADKYLDQIMKWESSQMCPSDGQANSNR